MDKVKKSKNKNKSISDEKNMWNVVKKIIGKYTIGNI